MTFSWEAVGAICAVVSVLAALGALFYQVRSLQRSIQSGTYQEILRMFDEFSRLMIEKPELSDVIFAKEGDPVRASDAKLQARIDWALTIRFDWFESIVIQRQHYKAIPEDIYEHWLDVLESELDRPTIRKYWQDHGAYYHPALQGEVDRILE